MSDLTGPDDKTSARAGTTASTEPAFPPDPVALIRSRKYRGLLVLAALVGIVVSLAAWGVPGAGARPSDMAVRGPS